MAAVFIRPPVRQKELGRREDERWKNDASPVPYSSQYTIAGGDSPTPSAKWYAGCDQKLLQFSTSVASANGRPLPCPSPAAAERGKASAVPSIRLPFLPAHRGKGAGG